MKSNAPAAAVPSKATEPQGPKSFPISAAAEEEAEEGDREQEQQQAAAAPWSGMANRSAWVLQGKLLDSSSDSEGAEYEYSDFEDFFEEIGDEVDGLPEPAPKQERASAPAPLRPVPDPVHNGEGSGVVDTPTAAINSWSIAADIDDDIQEEVEDYADDFEDPGAGVREDRQRVAGITSSPS